MNRAFRLSWKFVLVLTIVLGQTMLAHSDSLVVESEDGTPVASVSMEVTNDVTGQQTDQTLAVTTAPATSTGADVIDPGDQVVSVQLPPDQCSVDLNIKQTDGSTSQMREVDICGLDGITVEEASLPNLNPVDPPPP